MAFGQQPAGSVDRYSAPNSRLAVDSATDALTTSEKPKGLDRKNLRDRETIVELNDVLERWYRLQDPPTDDWPVFPTGHYKSKYNALVDDLGVEQVESALEARDSDTKTNVLERLHREHEVPPPSISKEGVHRLMKRLTSEANIDLHGEYEYLTLHGARRALGRDLYAGGMSEKAQEALRHKSIETTHEAYTDVKMKDISESIDDVRG